MLNALTSKKLLAYILSEVSWTWLLWYAMGRGIGQWALLAMIVTKGFIQVGYILGQSYVDAYRKTVTDVIDHAGKEVEDAVKAVADEPTDPKIRKE